MFALTRVTPHASFYRSFLLISLFVLSSAIAVFAPKANAVSFNCSDASKITEFLICEDAWLSELDDHYTGLYGSLRQAVAGNEPVRKRIQKQSQAALRKRDSQCSDRECLISWYKRNRLRIYNELRTLRPSSLQTKLTPFNLFESLNLRSLPKELGVRLGHHCESYPNEYFPNIATTVRKDMLVIETDPGFIKFSIIDNNTIGIATIASMRESYPEPDVIKVFFDPIAKDIRASVGLDDGGELFEIAPAENCVPIRGGENTDIREDKAKARRARAYLAQGQSVGEFGLAREFEATTFPVYNARKGLVLGQLTMSVKFDGVEGTVPKLAFTPANGEALPSPQIIYRAKYYPSMLVFDRSGAWFNISADPKNRLWINGKELPPELINVFNTREEVMLDASVIEVKSGHRLRAEANTNSEILKVLQPRENAQIFPLEIAGDWMRVRYISPESHLDLSLEELRADPTFTVLEGWLKWRESARKQYVEVRYMIGI